MYHNTKYLQFYVTVYFDCRFSNLLKLQEHLTSVHNFEVSIKYHEFCNIDEFEKWKAAEELATKSYYVRNSSAKTYGTSKIHYLYCNRSGHKAKGSGKRQLKLQGSCKIDKVCLSHIKAVENLESNMVSVEYCSTHTSHNMELCHLPIPEAAKHAIALKVQEGVAVERTYFG